MKLLKKEGEDNEKIELIHDYLITFSEIVWSVVEVDNTLYLMTTGQLKDDNRYKKEFLKMLEISTKKFNELKEKEIEKLKLLIDIKNKVLDFLLREVIELEEFDNKKDILIFLHEDKKITGKAFEIYNDLLEIKNTI